MKAIKKMKSAQLSSLLEEINEFEKYINQKFTSISILIPKIDFFGQRWEINKLIKSNKKEIDSLLDENNKKLNCSCKG